MFMTLRWIRIAFGIIAAAAAGLIGLAVPASAENTLVIAAVTEPEGIDGDILQPGGQNVVVQMYEGITAYQRTKDASGNTILDSRNVKGHLAESWTISEGGKLVTFKLRRGVKSPFGNEMTADDWVWSWNKSFKQKRTGNFIARVSNVVPNGVEKVDDYTVNFKLDGPSALLLKAITLYSPSIYDTKVTKEHATPDDPFAENWIRTNSAGYGPYHLAELRPGEQAVFTANPNYFAGKPYFDRVVYRAVPSGASRLTLIRSGHVDLIEKMTAQQLNELQKDPNVRVLWVPGRGVASVRMNMGIPPFTDVRVRKALNHAVNKQAVIDDVFFGQGQAANTIVPAFIDGAIKGPISYPHDVAKAKRLLAEAGYPNGLEVELNYSNFLPWEEPMAINIQSQLKAAGVTVKLARITAKELIGHEDGVSWISRSSRVKMGR